MHARVVVVAAASAAALVACSAPRAQRGDAVYEVREPKAGPLDRALQRSRSLTFPSVDAAGTNEILFKLDNPPARSMALELVVPQNALEAMQQSDARITATLRGQSGRILAEGSGVLDTRLSASARDGTWTYLGSQGTHMFGVAGGKGQVRFEEDQRYELSVQIRPAKPVPSPAQITVRLYERNFFGT